MNIEIFNDTKRRYVSVKKDSFLCKRLHLRDKLMFETRKDTWSSLFKTKAHKRKLKTLAKINKWLQWYVPIKLNCENWYCNKKEQNDILKEYETWEYTILYVV